MAPTRRAEPDRTILHVDMDAFFVSAELVRRPELRGLPVVVGGSGDRGVIAAASYEARAYGVHSAQPSVRARRLCPQAVFLDGDHGYYGEVSRRVMTIFGSYSPFVEPLSLDEAFLDISGTTRLHGTARDLAEALRRTVFEQEGMTCSVGIAPNKFLAKLASESAKPKATPQGPVAGPGVTQIVAGTELEFLHPLPIRALWGVGPKTQIKLERLGVKTVGDLARLPIEALTAATGDAVGHHLARLARAEDDRPVETERATKSISHEETFAVDRTTHAELHLEVVRLGDAVAMRLRNNQLGARTISIKVRFGDFRTITRSITVDEPLDSGPAISRLAKDLVDSVDPSAGVRLFGIAAGGLTEESFHQLSLGLESEGADDPRASGGAAPEVTEAIDAIRKRFGPDAIVPAALAGPHAGGAHRPGSHQWGPGREPDTEEASRRR